MPSALLAALLKVVSEMGNNKLTASQEKAVSAVRSAMALARRAGLHLYVYDGAVLMATKEHVKNKPYGAGLSAFDSEWIEQCEDVTSGISADGGAGV